MESQRYGNTYFFTYNSETSTLYIRLRENEAEHVHRPVPAHIYGGLLAAKNKSAYYWDVIAFKYPRIQGK